MISESPIQCSNVREQGKLDMIELKKNEGGILPWLFSFMKVFSQKRQRLTMIVAKFIPEIKHHVINLLQTLY